MLVKILAYFVPFAINFLNGGFFFITAHRFSLGDCPRIIVASSLTAWGIAYCLVTSLIGKKVNDSNALKLILSGGVILILTSIGFIIFDGLYIQLLWLALCGCGAALFCTPFQLFAKSIESGEKKAQGTVKATAFYTLTWSLGFASGPLAFAKLPLHAGFAITLALAAAVTGSVLLIAICRKGKTAPREENDGIQEEKQLIFPEKSYSKLAILGWIVGGLGTVTVSQIRGMWPKTGDELNFSQDQVAYVLALVSYVQAFTALLLARSKSWMWKRLPAFFMSACGIAALIAFAFCKTLPAFYLAAAVYGIYSGCLYFYLVYHSLAHPSKSGFFVAGNEVVVGITSMIAPLAGGFIADCFQFTGAAFIFAAIMVFTAFLFQLSILRPEKLAEGK